MVQSGGRYADDDESGEDIRYAKIPPQCQTWYKTAPWVPWIRVPCFREGAAVYERDEYLGNQNAEEEKEGESDDDAVSCGDLS
jgi:hypothetical protein